MNPNQKDQEYFGGTRNSSSLSQTSKKKYIDLHTLSKQSLNGSSSMVKINHQQQKQAQLQSWDGHDSQRQRGSNSSNQIQASPRFAFDDPVIIQIQPCFQQRAQTQSNQNDPLNTGNIQYAKSEGNLYLSRGVTPPSQAIQKQQQQQQFKYEEDQQNHQAWEQQRELLLSLVEKNQKLSQDLQYRYETEKEEMQNKFTKTLSQIKGEIKTLKEQNKLLRELPMASSQKTLQNRRQIDSKKYTEELRSQLIGEIDRLSRVYEEREADLQNQNQRVQDRLKAYETQLNSMRNQKEGSQMEYEQKIQTIQKQNEIEKNKLCSKLRDLQDEKNHLEACFKIKQQELNILQQQQSCGLSNQNQSSPTTTTSPSKGMRAEFQQAIKQIMQNIGKSQSLIEEKENIFATHIDNLKDEFEKSSDQLKTKISITQSEKKGIEQNLGAQLQLKTQELIKVTDMLEKLKDNSESLIQITKKKEEAYESDLQSLQNKVDQLKGRLVNDRKAFENETRTLVNSLQDYQKLLSDAEQKLQKGWEKQESIVIQVQKQNNALLQQVSNKNQIIESLKKKVLDLQTHDSKKINEFLTSSQSNMKEVAERQDSLFTDYQKLQEEFVQCDQSHSKLQEQDCKQMNSVLDELSDCRFKLKQAQTELANKEYDQIKKALYQTQAELDHTKLKLNAYMDSVKQLQVLQSSSNLNDNNDENQRQEVVKLKIQNSRLNDELQTAKIAKLKIEGLLGDRLNEVETKLTEKSSQYDRIMTKFIKLQQTGTYLREEELLAWKKRQESILSFLQRLNHQLERFKLQKSTVEKIKKQQNYLMIQELDLLKKSTGKVEEFWHQQHITWNQERQELETQIKLMQGRVNSSSTFYKEMGKFLEREKGIYEGVNGKLKLRVEEELSEEKQQQKNRDFKSRAEVRMGIQNQKQQQIIHTLQQEITVFREQLNIERVNRVKEMEAKEAASTEKLVNSRRKQISAVTQVANLEQKYQNLQQIFSKLGQNKAQEVGVLRIEVEAIKRLLQISQGNEEQNDKEQKRSINEIENLAGKIEFDVKKECQSMKEKNSIQKIEKKLKQIEEIVYQGSSIICK